jgi:hypothetical protein
MIGAGLNLELDASCSYPIAVPPYWATQAFAGCPSRSTAAVSRRILGGWTLLVSGERRSAFEV